MKNIEKAKNEEMNKKREKWKKKQEKYKQTGEKSRKKREMGPKTDFSHKNCQEKS